MQALLSTMHATHADFTRTFVTLSSLASHDDKGKEDLAKVRTSAYSFHIFF